MAQHDTHQQDRRAAMLEAFDSMTDDAQDAALRMTQSIARGSPRRPLFGLHLVANGNKSLNLLSAPGSV